MHGAHFRPAVSGAYPPARRASELGEQRVQDPGIAAVDLGKDVDVHFLEHVQGCEDVVMEGKGQMAGRGEGAGGGGMGVCEVGGDEIAPKEFDLWEIEGVGVLRKSEGEGASEEQEVEAVCGGGRGGVAG